MNSSKENVYIYDSVYIPTNYVCTKKTTVEPNNVIINDTSYIPAEQETTDNDDDDCVTITSKDSYESFDSWINDDLLAKEQERAKIEFKKDYVKKCKET